MSDEATVGLQVVNEDNEIYLVLIKDNQNTVIKLSPESASSMCAMLDRAVKEVLTGNSEPAAKSGKPALN